MCASVTLGLWKSNQLHRIKMDNVNLDSKAQLLKEEAVKKLEGKLSDLGILELTFRGSIVEDEKSLTSYGIKNGSIIYVVEKKPPPKLPQSRKLTEKEAQQLANLFKPFKLSRVSPGFRTALQRLTRPEALENILAATPGLSEDVLALSVIQDPELIIQMTQPDVIRRVAEHHPSLIDAVQYMATHMHDEQANINPNLPTTSSGYSYSLGALSDDEDMDTGPDGRDSTSIQRNSSFNAITAAQLASAIAAATNTVFNTDSAGVADGTNNVSSSGGVITSEMFSNAMQQAFATSPIGGSDTPPFRTSTPVRNEEQNVSSVYQAQLRQMWEIGLTNDAVNVRALQAANGDVQMAIDLVLNGVIE